jgi:DMSO/TMAO reductase YedYZ heme-binding membrane subunit
MSSQVWWYAARASGLVAWVLLAASVLLGLSLSTHKRVAGNGRPWVLDLHRFLGGLATVFVGVHVGALVADSYTHFGLIDVLVPFVSSWRPVAVAWGVVGLWLLLAVELTSLLRRSLPNRIWRRVHVLSFPLYVVASVHFLAAGSEGTSAAARLVVLGVSVAVVALTGERWARLQASRARDGARPLREPVPEHSARRSHVVVVAGAAQHEQRHVVRPREV